MPFDLMYDLETMSKQPNAAIVSIGAVLFDAGGVPLGELDLTSPHGKPVNTFYANVDLQSSMDAGLAVDADTIYWWLQQPREAREALIDSIWSLKLVLQMFNTWINRLSDRSAEYATPTQTLRDVWCHGASFDHPILKEASRLAGVRLPWSHKQERDTRTLFADAKRRHGWIGDKREFTGRHNALVDAWERARMVQEVYALDLVDAINTLLE